MTNSREVATWQQEGQDSSWHGLRTGLITLFVVLAAWVLYAQREVFQHTTAFVVTLGGGITAILNLLSSFRGKSGESKK